MISSKKLFSLLKPQLKGSLKKDGVELLRYSFTGIDKISGAVQQFFIEVYYLNPNLHPDSCTLGYKARVNLSEEAIHNVLAGTQSAKKLESENIVKPSYIAIKAGVFGSEAKQFNQFFAQSNISISNKSFYIRVGNTEFTDNKLTGEISYTPEDIKNNPEYMSSTGSISWNLLYDFKNSLINGYSGKNENWNAPGITTNFSGSITLNGREYNVVPSKSFGITEHFWAQRFPETWFHVSSSNLTSIISGKLLDNSNFAVQGIFDNRATVYLKLEQNEILLSCHQSKRAYECIWDCSQSPGDEDGEKLHLSISAHNKNYVIDIDVFCPTQELCIRNWEKPEGQRKLLRNLTCGSGTGEIRLYKRIKQNLELIEHAQIQTALAEYGQPVDSLDD